MRGSSIVVGEGAASRAERWARGLGSRLCLVTDARIRRLHGRGVLAGLKKVDPAAEVFLLPEGEKAKSLETVERLWRSLSRTRFGRDSALVALGGGAVTDAAGFAASAYLRGIPWVSVPTTLLGQVDSGIGGKTGVNLPEGKNLVGAFHQPAVVVCDTSFLRTLPRRETLSGLGEALKYGLVFDPALWRRMTGSFERLLRLEPGPLAAVVRRCASWKATVVTRDERELTGLRETLNFGHTFAHALEAEAGYGRLRHGEAVVHGMRAALWLSAALVGLPAREAGAADAFLADLPVAPVPRGLSTARLLERMSRDKKARGGALRFVLLRRFGESVGVTGVPPRLAAAAMDAAGWENRP